MELAVCISAVLQESVVLVSCTENTYSINESVVVGIIAIYNQQQGSLITRLPPSPPQLEQLEEQHKGHVFRKQPI